MNKELCIPYTPYKILNPMASQKESLVLSQLKIVLLNPSLVESLSASTCLVFILSAIYCINF